MKKKPNSQNKKHRKPVTENTHLRYFINAICEGDLAKANAHLEHTVEEKIKSRISNTLRNS